MEGDILGIQDAFKNPTSVESFVFKHGRDGSPDPEGSSNNYQIVLDQLA